MKYPRMPKEFGDDLEWGSQHHTELLEKYPDMWVAVVRGRVVSAGKNLAKVKEEARRKTNRKYIPVVYVECGDHIYG